MPLDNSTTTVTKNVKRCLKELLDAAAQSTDQDSDHGPYEKYRKICLETKFGLLSIDKKKN